MKPRVFVLEDDEYRISWFKSKYPNALITKDVDDAVTLLSTNEFDVIFLDHDLEAVHYGGYTGSEERTGRDVARWLAENPKASPNAAIIVHSLNASGASAMIDKMWETRGNRKLVRCPFITLRNLVGTPFWDSKEVKD